jgi:hypothetical protein
MFPNSLPSENLAVLATYDPVSQAAATVTTGWVDMRKFLQLLAVIQTGVLGASATVDAKLQQATDSGGTGAKDITGKAITQIVKASGDNKQVMINLRPEQLDVNNNFAFARLSITVGTAASQVSALLLGVQPRNGLASDLNQAGVVQIVS